MGEITDMILDGILCEECGGYIGEAVGYPRSCCSGDTVGDMLDLDFGDEFELEDDD